MQAELASMVSGNLIWKWAEASAKMVARAARAALAQSAAREEARAVFPLVLALFLFVVAPVERHKDRFALAV